MYKKVFLFFLFTLLSVIPSSAQEPESYSQWDATFGGPYGPLLFASDFTGNADIWSFATGDAAPVFIYDSGEDDVAVEIVNGQMVIKYCPEPDECKIVIYGHDSNPLSSLEEELILPRDGAFVEYDEVLYFVARSTITTMFSENAIWTLMYIENTDEWVLGYPHGDWQRAGNAIDLVVNEDGQLSAVEFADDGVWLLDQFDLHVPDGRGMDRDTIPGMGFITIGCDPSIRMISSCLTWESVLADYAQANWNLNDLLLDRQIEGRVIFELERGETRTIVYYDDKSGKYIRIPMPAPANG